MQLHPAGHGRALFALFAGSHGSQSTGWLFSSLKLLQRTIVLFGAVKIGHLIAAGGGAGGGGDVGVGWVSRVCVIA